MSHGHNTFFQQAWPYLDKEPEERTDEDIEEIRKFLFRDPRGYSEPFMKFKSDTDAPHICRIIRHVSLYPGQELYRRGDSIDTFFVIVLGKVGIYAVRKLASESVAPRNGRRGSVMSWGNLRGFVRGSSPAVQHSPLPLDLLDTMHPFATLGELALVRRGEATHQTTAKSMGETVHLLVLRTSEYLSATRKIRVKRNLHDIKFLLTTPLFEHYSFRGVSWLLELKLFKTAELTRGQTVVKQGRKVDQVYILIRGSCTSVYDLMEDLEEDTSHQIAPVPQPRRATGKRIERETIVELASLGEGQVFGAMAVVTEQRQQFSIVVTSGTAELYTMSAKNFLHFLPTPLHEHIHRTEALRSEVWMDKVETTRDSLIASGQYTLKNKRNKTARSSPSRNAQAKGKRPGAVERLASDGSLSGSPSRPRQRSSRNLLDTDPQHTSSSSGMKPSPSQGSLNRTPSSSGLKRTPSSAGLTSNRTILPSLTNPPSSGRSSAGLSKSRSVSNVAQLASEAQRKERSGAQRRLPIGRSSSQELVEEDLPGRGLTRSKSMAHGLSNGHRRERSSGADNHQTLRNELLEESSFALMNAINKVKQSRARKTPSPVSTMVHEQSAPAGLGAGRRIAIHLGEGTRRPGSGDGGSSSGLGRTGARDPHRTRSRPSSPVRAKHLLGTHVSSEDMHTLRGAAGKPPPSPKTLGKSPSVTGVAALAQAAMLAEQNQLQGEQKTSTPVRRSLKRSTSIDTGMANLNDDGSDPHNRTIPRRGVKFMHDDDDTTPQSKPAPDKVVVVRRRSAAPSPPNPLLDPEFDDDSLFRKPKTKEKLASFSELVHTIKVKSTGTQPKPVSILKPQPRREAGDPDPATESMDDDQAQPEEEDAAARIEMLTEQIEAMQQSIKNQLHVPRKPRSRRQPGFTGQRASPRVVRTHQPNPVRSTKSSSDVRQADPVPPGQSRSHSGTSQGGSASRSASPSHSSADFGNRTGPLTTRSVSKVPATRVVSDQDLYDDRLAVRRDRSRPVSGLSDMSERASHASSRGSGGSGELGGRSRARSRTVEDSMLVPPSLGSGKTTPEPTSSLGQSPSSSRPASPTQNAPLSNFDANMQGMKRRLLRRTSTTQSTQSVQSNTSRTSRPKPGDPDFDPFSTPP